MSPTKEQFFDFVKRVPEYIENPRFLLDESIGVIYAVSGTNWRGNKYPNFTKEISASGEELD